MAFPFGAHCALKFHLALIALFRQGAIGEEEKDHLIVFSLRFDCVFI